MSVSSELRPSTLTCSLRRGKLQYEGYLRRENVNAAVLKLSKAGVAIKELARRTGHSRGLVK